jgi:hypothetical protein
MVRLVEAWRKLSQDTKKKAAEHKDCADIAKQNRLYNSAVSRYYYYCLLLAKSYIIENEMCRESYFGGSNSHKAIHTSLHAVAKEQSLDVYTNVCVDLDLIRMSDYRIDADYKGSQCFVADQGRFRDFLDLVSEFEIALEEIKTKEIR